MNQNRKSGKPTSFKSSLKLLPRYTCQNRTMATFSIYLSTSKELNTSSESLSSNSSTSDNLFTCSSEKEEEEKGEEGVSFKNNLDDSEECECDQCYSGAYRVSACGKRTVCRVISSLRNEITDLQKNNNHLQVDLIKKDREIKDKNTVIDSLETQFKMVSEELEQVRNTNDKRIQELEEQLNEKDQNITETNSLETQCKIIPELEEKLNEKYITEKNKVNAALENQCKLECAKLEEICKSNNDRIQGLKETLNKKDKDIEEKSNVIAALEKQCKMESEKLEQICKTSNERIQELEKTLNEKNQDITEKSNAIAALDKQCKMIKELVEKLCKKDKEITEMNGAVATLEKQCEINKLMQRQIQFDSEVKRNKTVLEVKASGVKRLQKNEEIHPALQSELDDLQKKLDNYEALLAKTYGKLKLLTNELRREGKEKEKPVHRLNKIAGDRLNKMACAKRTYINSNIADLSDEERPTKLAEEFAELYDNEWTDAFEVVDIERDEDKIAYMLSLLKEAYGLCKLASQNHMEHMKSSICKLTVDVKQTSGDVKQTSGEINKHPKTKCGKVVFDYEKFQDEQKKAVMELGKFVKNKLSTEFEKIVVDDIASEYCIDKNDRKKLYVYIQKCVNVCWSMCRLEIPVAIGLLDVYDGMHLDTNVFKLYTKSGQFMDYLVWPPLYLHENGPLLCKGVAQGKA